METKTQLKAGGITMLIPGGFTLAPPSSTAP
jgi:hypothetical protein